MDRRKLLQVQTLHEVRAPIVMREAKGAVRATRGALPFRNRFEVRLRFPGTSGLGIPRSPPARAPWNSTSGPLALRVLVNEQHHGIPDWWRSRPRSCGL